MSLVVIFDEGASPEKVLGVVRSANTPDFDQRTDVVINPDIAALDGVVPQKYWKHDTGSIIEYTQGEKDAQDAADVAAADAALRVGAKGEFDGDGGLAKRALVEALIREINILRQWIMQYKVDVAAAANLGGLQASVAASNDLPDRTLAQAKGVIQGAIDGGDVDE